MNKSLQINIISFIFYGLCKGSEFGGGYWTTSNGLLFNANDVYYLQIKSIGRGVYILHTQPIRRIIFLNE